MSISNNSLAMKALLAFMMLVVATPSTYATESKAGAAKDVAGILFKVLENSQRKRAVIVENWTARTVRLWCASGNDRITHDGKTYVDLKDQQALGWTFTPNVFPGFSGSTLFWCTVCYKNQKRGWHVYDQIWETFPGDDGIPDNGILKWRIIRDSVRWLENGVKPGWDFAHWPSDGPC